MRDAVREWQALSALYEQAETLTAPELDLWLARLRSEAHPLLEPLQQMLGARAEIQDNGFLDALPRLPPPGVRVDDDRAGERIGPYRLLARIGSGGMAEVWRAERDDGAFRRTVAVKLLFRHVGGARGESFAQRFSRERDILASLDHPNIAGLHDAGVTPQGQPWLALEYVEGEPLNAWCDRARIGLRARVEVFRQVLLAVEHAHANLVIHRDLKPGNILVSAVGEVRLLDFGIAKLMESADGGALDESELTRHAGRLMTVAYASPEQLTGRPLTTATDVYSLGVVLYELLCGERPYEVRTDLPARLEQAILETDPRPPSRRAGSENTAAARGATAASLRKQFAPDLDAIVLRALAKQPAQRYGSVEALRADLDRWLAGKPVEARAPGAVERLRKFVRRHPVGASLGTAAVAALLTVAGVAVALGLQARAESARATAARDFLMGMFRQADTDKSHGADVTARELLDRGRDDVLRRLKDQPALQADLLQGIAGIQSGMGEVTKADVTLEALAKLHRRLGDPLATARALVARADNALRLGRLSEAEALVAEVEALPRSAKGDAEIAIGVGLTRGWLVLWAGDAARARAVFQQALARAEAAFGPTATQALSALVGVVQSEANAGNFDAALKAENELERRQLQVPGRTPRDMVELDVNHGELLLSAGRWREIVDRKQSAIPRCVAAFGLNDVNCRRLMLVGAAADVRVGFSDAVRANLDVLQAMARDESSPDIQRQAVMTLARSLSQLGELDRHPDVVAQLRSIVGNDRGEKASPVRRVMALHLLAEDALRRGRAAEAEQRLREAKEQIQRQGEQVPGYVAAATQKMLSGLVLSAKNRPADALEALQAGQSEESAAIGASHPQALLHSLNQVAALVALGRLDEAVRQVDAAAVPLAAALGADSPTYKRVTGMRNALAFRRLASSVGEARQAPTKALRGPASDDFEFFD